MKRSFTTRPFSPKENRDYGPDEALDPIVRDIVSLRVCENDEGFSEQFRSLKADLMTQYNDAAVRVGAAKQMLAILADDQPLEGAYDLVA